MASFGSEFRTYLKTKTAVTSLVGTGTAARIYPDILRQGAAMPAVVYLQGGGGDSYEHLGTPCVGLAQTIMHVYAYGATRETASALSEVVRIAIQRYRGLMGSTQVNEVSALSDEQTDVDPSMEKSDIHRWIAHRVYSIHHAEATA